jgi:long-chain acyl-CoA synthetase
MYGGLTEQFMETSVRFEDGRIGSVSATLTILEAKVFSTAPAQKEAA